MELTVDREQIRTEALNFFLNEGVLTFGDFTLKSGRPSPYFFNTGSLCSGRQLAEMGRLYASMLASLDEFAEVTVIFGSAYKGIPISVASTIAFADSGNEDIRALSDRKEPKEHGDISRFLGEYRKGDKAIIVDDVISSGATKIEAIAKLEEIGVQTLALVIAFDRGEPAGESGETAVERFERESGCAVYPLLTVHDVIEQREDLAETLRNHLQSFAA
jgi:orotate phosphoribosyltransferase